MAPAGPAAASRGRAGTVDERSEAETVRAGVPGLTVGGTAAGLSPAGQTLKL